VPEADIIAINLKTAKTSVLRASGEWPTVRFGSEAGEQLFGRFVRLAFVVCSVHRAHPG
jgi:hypothetical protein